MHVNEERETERIVRTSGVNARKCMKCGKCSATCPAFEEMDIHPHRFVSMVEEGDVLSLLTSKSLWKCLSCFACVERCPRNVEPANLIEAVRALAVRPIASDKLKPETVPALVSEDNEIPQQLLVSAFRKYSK
jgi:heterodisulfide reductase subunit C